MCGMGGSTRHHARRRQANDADLYVSALCSRRHVLVAFGCGTAAHQTLGLEGGTCGGWKQGWLGDVGEGTVTDAGRDGLWGLGGGDASAPENADTKGIESNT